MAAFERNDGPRRCDDCGRVVADPGSRPIDQWAEKFCFARQYAHQRAECLQRKIDRLELLINTPQTIYFLEAVKGSVS